MAWRLFLSYRVTSRLPFPSSSFSTSFLKTKLPKHLRRRHPRPPSPRTSPIQPSPSTTLHYFESLLLRDARFRFLTRTLHFLSSLSPPHLLPLRPSSSYCSSLHRDLGFPRGRNPLRFVRLHPLLFSTPLVGSRLHLGLTPLALSLLKERDRIMDAAETDHVSKVRKLLMMSAGKKIALNKLYHCRAIFGLPDDFRDRALKYPEYFRVVTDGDGRKVLELARWDAALAVTEIEKEFMVDDERVKRKFNFPVKYSRHMGLPEEDRRKVNEVNTLPLISPYGGWVGGEGDGMSSLEAEKYRVGLLHEFLSLTLEKRASIHHIVEFKEEFRLTRRTYETLRKQPRCFYLAGTEMNWAVFLREGYDKEGKLKVKDPLVSFNERLYTYAEMKSLEEAKGWVGLLELSLYDEGLGGWAAHVVGVLCFFGTCRRSRGTCEAKSSIAESVVGFPDNLCPIDAPRSSPRFVGVIEGDEVSLQRALAPVHSNSETYVAVLFYASWCPFSRVFRPTFSILSALFPSIHHFAIEESSVRPSILSKYGVHGFPTLFIMNSTLRDRYRGPRTLGSLVAFYYGFTGIESSSLDTLLEGSSNFAKYEKHGNNDPESCPFWWARSPENLLPHETYLGLATAFVLFRLLYFLYPMLIACAEWVWRRHIRNMGLLSMFEHFPAYLKRVILLFKSLEDPCNRSNLQEGARNAGVWASKSLATVSIGEASSSRNACLGAQ